MKDSRFELYYPLLSAWDGKQNLSVNQFFPPVLNHEDKALIAGFLNGLGSSDVEGQLAHCNLYQVRIENNLREAENRKNSLSRLYLSLGVLAGIAVAIVCL